MKQEIKCQKCGTVLWLINTPENKLSQLMIMAAFRYSLSRTSYISDACAEFLVDIKEDIDPLAKKMMAGEIRDYLDDGEIADSSPWINVLEEFEKE